MFSMVSPRRCESLAIIVAFFSPAKQDAKSPPASYHRNRGGHILYWCFLKPSRNTLQGFLIAAWAGDKIAEFSFPEISFHFPLRPCFFFVSPAYAGKSRSGSGSAHRRWDHPRVCGEKLARLYSSVPVPGSPPRMRGKGCAKLNSHYRVGITPAYAGKSLCFVI